MIRTIIADDHAIIRLFLRSWIERRAGWCVCEEASDGIQAVQAAMCHKPHIALLDIGMRSLNGIEAAARISHACKSTNILMFSVHRDRTLVQRTIAAGAKGFVLKSDSVVHLDLALDALAQDAAYFSPEISDILLEQGGEPEPLLTLHQRAILQLLAEGHTNKDIARALKLSVATVQTHRASIMRKLNFDSVGQLIRYAVRNKIIEA
jgi:DNA-binding NarL/FixJ family response regulator